MMLFQYTNKTHFRSKKGVRENRFPALLDVVRGRMRKMSVDSGLVVVVFITLGYLFLVFGLFFYVKNEWCELLFKNNTVRARACKKTKQPLHNVYMRASK